MARLKTCQRPRALYQALAYAIVILNAQPNDAQTSTITTFAGTGEPGFSGDGGKATQAQINWPSDIFVDGAGHIFFADTHNHRIRKIDAQGIITTIAGSGESGYNGDGIAATAAQITLAYGLHADARCAWKSSRKRSVLLIKCE